MAVASCKLGALVFVAVLCLSLPTGCLSSQQAALFVFGDSLFDPGNNHHTSTPTPQLIFMPTFGHIVSPTSVYQLEDSLMAVSSLKIYAYNKLC